MEYDEQVKAVVRSFVQVWNKFENTITRELTPPEDGGHDGPGDRDTRFTASHDLLYRVGNSININSSMTMGELSAALSVPLSSATRIVDWMVENGYMQRLPDPEDRRIVRVTFTHEGRALYQTVDGQINQHLHQIALDLTPQELASLIILLNKVMNSLKKELSKQHESPSI